MTKHRIITNGEKFRVETQRYELVSAALYWKRRKWVKRHLLIHPRHLVEHYKPVEGCLYRMGEWEVERASAELMGSRGRPHEFNTYAQAVQWIRREYGKRAHIEPREWRPA